jgi:hypothetical protein
MNDDIKLGREERSAKRLLTKREVENARRDWEQRFSGPGENAWFSAAMALLLVALVLASFLLVLRKEVVELRAANQELARSAITGCSALRLGDLAWFRIGSDGEPECLRTSAPPTSAEWRKYLRRKGDLR